MASLTDIGFITMAFGPEKYLDQARTLALSIKRWMPGFKLAVVTDSPDPGACFDIVIPMERFATAGTIHKADLYNYSPFEETFFIDSDCVVARDFSAELAEIRAHDFSPVCTSYLRAGDQDFWLEDVGEALLKVGGKSFPKFNGGVYFYRKSSHAAEVFERARGIRARAAELGVKDFDKAGPGEETLIGLALAAMGVENLYHDRGRLMRTPLNSTGPIELDVLGGRCSFIKEGEPVSPAICHFCGDWITHPAYAIAAWEIANGRRAPAYFKAGIHAGRLRRKLEARVGRGVRKLTAAASG